MKRRFGNTFSRPFGMLLCVFGIVMITSGISMYGYVFSIMFIIGGLALGFGKEMTKINFTQQYINQYIQILFIKLNNKKPLPSIAYLLVRDFLPKDRNYSSIAHNALFYEISFVTNNDKKIILALYQDEKRVNKLIDQIRKNKSLIIKDNTGKKILNKI